MSDLTNSKYPSAFILAAGLGTRLRPFTEVMPKPYLPVLGKSVFSWVVDNLLEFPIAKMGTNIHHLPAVSREEIKKALREHTPLLEMTISDETKLLLGSAGGIRAGWETLEKPEAMILTNADVICPVPWKSVWEQHLVHRKKGYLATLVLKRNPPNTGKYREIKTENEKVAGYGDVKSGVTFYTGSAILDAEIIQEIEHKVPSEFREVVLDKWIPRNKVAAVFLEEISQDTSLNWWVDIGSPDLWHEAHFQILDFFSEASQKAKRYWPKKWKDTLTEIKAPSKRVWISPAGESTKKFGPDFVGYFDVGFGQNRQSDLDSKHTFKNGIYYASIFEPITPSKKSLK